MEKLWYFGIQKFTIMPLSSAVAHMQLGILIDNDKEFKKHLEIMKQFKHQRKDGSLPIEIRRGGRAMFYQGRAMNALLS